jgi:hypothetical protein
VEKLNVGKEGFVKQITLNLSNHKDSSLHFTQQQVVGKISFRMTI